MISFTYLGGQETYADILQFSDSKGDEKWIKVGEMSRSRYGQAASLVNFTNYEQHCTTGDNTTGSTSVGPTTTGSTSNGPTTGTA